MQLDARPVSLDALLDVALHAAPVRLSAAAAWRRRIDRSRAELERLLRRHACVYGVSTGVGNSSSDAVGRDGQAAYARSVMAQHGCGVGEPFPELVAYDGCGVKGLQMTCSALTALAIQRAAPDSVLSRSTECANQDKVSMGLNAAVNAREAVEHLASALATALIALSNAAVHRDEHRVSPAGRRLLGEIRVLSPVLREDRRLDMDIARLAAWIGRRPARR